jgi:hypothetical protein
MPEDPFGPYQVARTADLDRAQAAMEKVFLHCGCGYANPPRR